MFGGQSRRDVQWRLAVLYFIRGWSTRQIARRYGLTRERCGQLISDWRIRAVNMGYIQDITPDESGNASSDASIFLSARSRSRSIAAKALYP